ncbi:MAG TPA: response regulator, partial [Anaerolineales bacterium]
MVRVDGLGSAHAPKISVVCDRSDTAPVWGYILRHKGLSVLLEQTIPGAFERWNRETPDLVVFDVDIQAHDPVELCRSFRALSVAPILVFLPGHHETQVLDCYGAGADEVIVKPVSPPIFLAKVMAWMRRSWVMPLT